MKLGDLIKNALGARAKAPIVHDPDNGLQTYILHTVHTVTGQLEMHIVKGYNPIQAANSLLYDRRRGRCRNYVRIELVPKKNT